MLFSSTDAFAAGTLEYTITRFEPCDQTRANHKDSKYRRDAITKKVDPLNRASIGEFDPALARLISRDKRKIKKLSEEGRVESSRQERLDRKRDRIVLDAPPVFSRITPIEQVKEVGSSYVSLGKSSQEVWTRLKEIVAEGSKAESEANKSEIENARMEERNRWLTLRNRMREEMDYLYKELEARKRDLRKMRAEKWERQKNEREQEKLERDSEVQQNTSPATPPIPPPPIEATSTTLTTPTTGRIWSWLRGR